MPRARSSKNMRVVLRETKGNSYDGLAIKPISDKQKEDYRQGAQDCAKDFQQFVTGSYAGKSESYQAGYSRRWGELYSQAFNLNPEFVGTVGWWQQWKQYND